MLDYTLGSSHNAVDINKTVESNIDLIPSILKAQAPSGCNRTARYYGAVKGTVVKHLKKGLQLLQLGDTESDSKDILEIVQSVHAVVLQQQI